MRAYTRFHNHAHVRARIRACVRARCADCAAGCAGLLFPGSSINWSAKISPREPRIAYHPRASRREPHECVLPSCLPGLAAREPTLFLYVNHRLAFRFGGYEMQAKAALTCLSSRFSVLRFPPIVETAPKRRNCPPRLALVKFVKVRRRKISSPSKQRT